MFRNIGQKILAPAAAGQHSVYNQIPSAISVQSIRWRVRRPLELGTSRKKLYFVKRKAVKDPEETPDMERLFKDYALKMASLEQHFRGLKAKRDVLLSKETVDGEKDADFARISKINDQWNRNVAEVRMARVARERAEEENRILADIEQRDAQREEQRRKINELVVKEKEAAKSFIVRENIDAAIDRVLSTPADFNFAIDIRDQIYPGRATAKAAVADENTDDQHTSQATA